MADDFIVVREVWSKTEFMLYIVNSTAVRISSEAAPT